MTTMMRGSHIAKLAWRAKPKGTQLKADGVTPAHWNVPSNSVGSQWGPAGSCAVEATPTCASKCYVKKSHKQTLNLLEQNLETIRELATADRWTELAMQYYQLMRTSYLEQLADAIAAPLYRVNWAGGIVNEWHAKAIRAAAAALPGLSVYLYTRNFFVLVDLLGKTPLPNLRILLSADVDNYKAAESMAELYHLQVAYMQGTPTRGKRTLVCPGVKRHVVPTRKSPTGYAGICFACRACVDTKATPDIEFPIH